MAQGKTDVFETYRCGDLVIEAYPQHAIAALDLDSVRVRPGEPDETVSAIQKAAKELSRSGYRKLLAPHVNSRHGELVRCLQRAGFTVRSETLLFECQLSLAVAAGGPARPALPAGVTVGDFTGVPSADIEGALLKCFPEEDPDSIVGRTVRAKSFLRRASAAARMEDETVGFTLVSARSTREAYLAYQGTVPECRGKGIGSCLLWRSVDVLAGLGFVKLVADQVYPSNGTEVRVLRRCRFEEVARQLNMSLDLQKLA